jgi:Cu+-exporting ATPase
MLSVSVDPRPRATTRPKGDSTMATEQLVIDPVCGMKIKPEDAVATIEHQGTTYYFCSQDCADSFRDAPEDYL